MDILLRKHVAQICKSIGLPKLYGLAEIQAMIDEPEVAADWQIAKLYNLTSEQLRQYPTRETREHFLYLKLSKVKYNDYSKSND